LRVFHNELVNDHQDQHFLNYDMLKHFLTGRLVSLIHDPGNRLYHELNDGLVVEHHLDSIPNVNDQQDYLQESDADHVGHLSDGFHEDLLLHPKF